MITGMSTGKSRLTLIAVLQNIQSRFVGAIFEVKDEACDVLMVDTRAMS